MRNINFVYPDDNNPDEIKFFQDLTSQIRGFQIKRSKLHDAKNLEYIENPCIYFLYDNNPEEKKIYIGQSINGIKRIEEHQKTKDFWIECLIFIADNNSFTKTTIDYLEYQFINLYKQTEYTLVNTDYRTQKPKITVFEEPLLKEFKKQIIFLLKANNILSIEKERISNLKIYFNKEKTAKINYLDGKFILLKGSLLKRPVESTKLWNDNGKFYHRNNQKIDEYMETSLINEI